MEEIWKEPPDFEGYEVSNFGNIRSWRWGHGRMGRSKEPRYLKPATDQYGYKRISLRRTDGKPYAIFVHTLVLNTFVGKRPDKMECCHIDDNKLNNHLTNLQWNYTKINRRDQTLHKLVARGEQHGFSKLTDKQVLELRKRYKNGEKSSALGNVYNISRMTVVRICKGQTWSHLPLAS